MTGLKKTILIIGIVDVTLLLSVFILLKWNMPVLNVHAAIDISRVAAFGDYFAGIATASTAIIIYLQVREMLEQRKARVRPELFSMNI